MIAVFEGGSNVTASFEGGSNVTASFEGGLSKWVSLTDPC